MARTPTQSRKMQPPRKPEPRGAVEGGGVTPIRALAKYLMDRADRKDFEKDDKIYKDAMKLLAEAQKNPKPAPKPAPKSDSKPVKKKITSLKDLEAALESSKNEARARMLLNKAIKRLKK